MCSNDSKSISSILVVPYKSKAPSKVGDKLAKTFSTSGDNLYAFLALIFVKKCGYCDVLINSSNVVSESSIISETTNDNSLAIFP